MIETHPLLKKILLKTEFRLFLFLGYVIALIYVWLTSHGWLPVFFVHLFFVFIFSIFYFGPKFLLFLAAPFMAIFLPIQSYFLKKYLKNFKQNTPAEVAIVLGQPNWFRLTAWTKIIFIKQDIKYLVQCLQTKNQSFSFYPSATFRDVEKIMSNKNTKEVYFVGHGTSHIFELSTDDPLYYCEFINQQKYGKEFIHQVHCGTHHGKSLIDYVVPEENRPKCFFFRKPINSLTIKKEFKKRIKNYPQK